MNLCKIFWSGLLALAVSNGRCATPTVRPALGLHAGADLSTRQYDDFGRWLGRKVLYRVVFCDARGWEGIAHPYFLAASARWLASDPRRCEVVSVPLLPDTDKGRFDAVASGAHDADFRSLGRELVKQGIAPRAIVRLGWEFNGDWFAWSAVKNPGGYRAAFRRAVRELRAAAPGLRIEWCANCGSTGKMGWTDAYPGDDVVDIISMDVYDQYNSGWEDILHRDAGLMALRAFAKAHHKPEAYPEWGCSTDAHGHGDDPAFVEHMAAWFDAGPRVVYQGYWNTAAGGPDAVLHGEGAGKAPKAAAAYKRLFGAGGKTL
jgi:hypothetical protein